MEFVALDLETSGLEPDRDRIIEIALVRFREGKITEQFSSLVNPRVAVDKHVLDLTGINQKDLEKAPEFSDLKLKIMKFIGNMPLVGHNLQFDLAFLKSHDLALSNLVYDTWHFSTLLLPLENSYSLEVLTNKFSLKQEEKHRALGDALASASLFHFLLGAIQTFPKDLRNQIQELGKKGNWSLGKLFSAEAEKSSFVIDDYLKNRLDKVKKEDKEAALIGLKAGEYLAKKESVVLEFPCAASFDGGGLELIEQAIAKKANLNLVVADFWYRSIFLPHYFPREVMDKMQIILPAFFQVDWGKIAGWRQRDELDSLYASVIAKILIVSSYRKTKEINLLDVGLTFEERDIWSQFSKDGSWGVLDTKKPIKLISQSLFLTDQKLQVGLLGENTPLVFWQVNQFRKELLQKSLLAITGLELKQLKEKGEAFLRFLARDSSLTEKIEQSLQNLKNIDTRLTLLLGMVAIFVKKHTDQRSYFKDLVLTEELENEYDFKQVNFLSEKILGEFADLQNSLSDLKAIALKQDAVLNQLINQVNDAALLFSRFFSDKDESFRLIKVREEEVTLSYFDRNYFDGVKKALGDSKASLLFADRNLSLRGKFNYFNHFFNFPAAKLKTASLSDISRNTQPIEIGVVTNLGYFSEPSKFNQYQEELGNFLLGSKHDCLIATNSFNSTQTFYLKFKDFLESKGYSVFAQGMSGGRAKIAEKIKENPPNVIIGTTRFLEKIEINPIDRLLILQLPFDHPNNPFVLAQATENSFNEVVLPEAILKFKEILGLALGVAGAKVTVWDQKLQDSEYGKDFRDSLPPCFKIVSLHL